MLARERRIYRQVTQEELAKVAGTVHHGGIVAITERDEPAGVTDEDVRDWAKNRAGLVVLDRVANHHNLGALVRIAAFFGLPVMIYGEHRDQALPGESTYRVAEGGMEYVDLRPVTSLAPFLRAIRPHYLVVGAALKGESLEDFRAARSVSRSGDGRPFALVLGNEEQGLSPTVLGSCERRVVIPGVGNMESLNVSAAGAILMHWFFGGG